ncbi:hypothetical protein Pryu01_03030 [Paraliobacillus ryukyuensis]|uniref:Uncharacterized protein n=1 Tax=Paraliobacillus ryukyuensis TaxID=200904 RepID=A0A366DS56_9BACI|nr:hypothetical protein [Paraliobacillus ryukyuensis]RBO92038.1 hypothetical protein DES48_1172 [Paraliobacillus ryukyuensis]
MKVVINKKFGGFSLSGKAIEYYAKLKGIENLFHYVEDIPTKLALKKTANEVDDNNVIFAYTTTKDFGDEVATNYQSPLFDHLYSPEIERNDEDLVKVIEELGEKANTRVSSLKIVEIPDDVEYVIEDYDGVEWIAEKHRTWS